MSSITIRGVGAAHMRESSGAEAVHIIRDRFGPVARRTKKAERDMSPFLDFIDMSSGYADGIAISCLSAQLAERT